ncbi:MAG: zinc-binding dehydrogenase [Halobacteriaceae archaeon]
MKAVQFTGFGDPDVIRYTEVPEPEPAADEVRIDVKAGALNHLDVWTRRGTPGLDLEHPHTPGSDAAGVVDAVGADVTRFEIGDRVAVNAGTTDGAAGPPDDPTLSPAFEVIGEHRPGLHAEFVTVPEANLVPVPEGVSWPTAAAAPLVFGTAWRMLVTRGDVGPADDVLVLGASGGVGHAAVQIATHAGATVYATGSTAAKRSTALDLGATAAFDYDARPFHREIRERTDGRGVDVVVDHVGEATWDRSLKSLAKGGRLLTCGATTGPNGETNINRVFWNQLSIIGSTMFTPGEAEAVLPLVWDGTFEVQIRDLLPMSETSRGHRLLEDREGFGKVVVIPDSEL